MTVAMPGGVWAAIMAGALGAVHAGIALGYSGDVSLNAITVAGGLLLLALERIVPEQPEWMGRNPELWQDIGHFVFGFSLGAFGGAALARTVFPQPLWTIWPVTWPTTAQAALGLVIGEFFMYWQHRAVHTIPALWPLHVLHHGTARMRFLKTTRIHAIDIGSSTFLSLAPLLAIGAPLPVVLWVTAFGNFAAQTQHANVRLRTPRWLNAIVGTPAVHWLHHSLDKREGNSNFGMNVMLWDHLFGTYLAPGPEPRRTLGVDPDPVPPTFVGQLLLPLDPIRQFWRRR